MTSPDARASDGSSTLQCALTTAWIPPLNRMQGGRGVFHGVLGGQRVDQRGDLLDRAEQEAQEIHGVHRRIDERAAARELGVLAPRACPVG